MASNVYYLVSLRACPEDSTVCATGASLTRRYSSRWRRRRFRFGFFARKVDEVRRRIRDATKGAAEIVEED